MIKLRKVTAEEKRDINKSLQPKPLPKRIKKQDQERQDLSDSEIFNLWLSHRI